MLLASRCKRQQRKTLFINLLYYATLVIVGPSLNGSNTKGCQEAMKDKAEL